MARIRTIRGCVWALAVADQWIPEVPSAAYEVERYSVLIDGREIVQVSIYQGERDVLAQDWMSRCSVAPLLPPDRFPPQRAAEVRRDIAGRLAEKQAVFEGEDGACVAAELRQAAADGPDLPAQPLPGGTIARPNEDGVLREQPAPPTQPYWRQRARATLGKERG